MPVRPGCPLGSRDIGCFRPCGVPRGFAGIDRKRDQGIIASGNKAAGSQRLDQVRACDAAQRRTMIVTKVQDDWHAREKIAQLHIIAVLIARRHVDGQLGPGRWLPSKISNLVRARGSQRAGQQHHEK